jgi:hypothetical protein
VLISFQKPTKKRHIPHKLGARQKVRTFLTAFSLAQGSIDFVVLRASERHDLHAVITSK